MATTSLSPSSSPRLPSPPPIAEVQLGPKSPIATTEEQAKLISALDHGASRRIRPGTKADDMAEGPPLVDLSEIDSAFQLTEHLKALHHSLTHPVDSNSTIAIDRDMAHKLAQPPENVDKTLWLYELCRFLTQKVNSIIVALFSDSPACSSITCPEMRASEWQYLCAVHDPPKSCCAIDYCCHTLDWAANTLTSPKNFPSRLAMGTDQSTHNQQLRNLTNIFRRVYRIFAHAWFQHRDMFWKVEGRTGLYVFFKTVCDSYGLIPEDNYTIPPEAEGVEGVEQTETTSVLPPLILKRDVSGSGPHDLDNTTIIDAGEHTLSTAGTTKRHRHSPSVGATAVSTVVEESEEEEGEQEPAEEEPSPSAPHQEPMAAPPSAASDDDDAEPDTPTTDDEEAQLPEETVSAGPEDPHTTDEPEKQTRAVIDTEEPHNEGPEAEATIPEAKAAEGKDEEIKIEAGEGVSKTAAPEKHDAPAADPDKAAESADPDAGSA